jgi:hypothetical protein
VIAMGTLGLASRVLQPATTQSRRPRLYVTTAVECQGYCLSSRAQAARTSTLARYRGRAKTLDNDRDSTYSAT